MSHIAHWWQQLLRLVMQGQTDWKKSKEGGTHSWGAGPSLWEVAKYLCCQFVFSFFLVDFVDELANLLSKLMSNDAQLGWWSRAQDTGCSQVLAHLAFVVNFLGFLFLGGWLCCLQVAKKAKNKMVRIMQKVASLWLGSNGQYNLPV